MPICGSKSKLGSEGECSTTILSYTSISTLRTVFFSLFDASAPMLKQANAMSDSAVLVIGTSHVGSEFSTLRPSEALVFTITFRDPHARGSHEGRGGIAISNLPLEFP